MTFGYGLLFILAGAGVLALVLAVQLAVGPRYSARPLLNKAERSVMAVASETVAALPAKNLMVFTQVSYGEFLTSSKRGFRQINSKRADFVLADAGFNVAAVIEHQGSGHYGSTERDYVSARRRDAVKRRALASAGIPMIEVPARFSPVNLRRQIVDALNATQDKVKP